MDRYKLFILTTRQETKIYLKSILKSKVLNKNHNKKHLEICDKIDLVGYSSCYYQTFEEMNKNKKLVDILLIEEYNLTKNEFNIFLNVFNQKFMLRSLATKIIICSTLMNNGNLKDLLFPCVSGILYFDKPYAMSMLNFSAKNHSKLNNIVKTLLKTITSMEYNVKTYTYHSEFKLFSIIYHNSCYSNVSLNSNLNKINPSYCTKRKSKISTLSKMEKKILFLMSQGLKNKEIANSLCISHHTVDAHKANLKLKLDIKNNSKLVVFAIENKLKIIDNEIN